MKKFIVVLLLVSPALFAFEETDLLGRWMNATDSTEALYIYLLFQEDNKGVTLTVDTRLDEQAVEREDFFYFLEGKYLIISPINSGVVFDEDMPYEIIYLENGEMLLSDGDRETIYQKAN